MKHLWLMVGAALLVGCGSGGGIKGEKTFNYKGGDHVQGRIQYKETPPAGGPHNPNWQNCGVYDAPLANEYAVHAMEHGAVWVTYRPDLSAADVAKLRQLVDGHSYTLLSPYPNLPSPVVISAWNHQVAVDSANDPRLQTFLKQYESGPQAPERGAPCTGGISDTQ